MKAYSTLPKKWILSRSCWNRQRYKDSEEQACDSKSLTFQKCETDSIFVGVLMKVRKITSDERRRMKRKGEAIAAAVIVSVLVFVHLKISRLLTSE